jgi:hypothetical protein
MKTILCILIALAVQSFGATDLKFDWDPSPTAAADGVNAYVVQKQSSPTTWSDVASVAPNVTTFLMKGIASGTYVFRVVARNLTGQSLPTNSVIQVVDPAPPPTIPGGPSNLRTTVIQVTVTVP